MNWSFPLLRVSGIQIKVHITFLLILALGAFWGAPYGPVAMGFGVLLMLLLFLCVTLHELGHSVAAQRFGIEVKEILLLPVGGLAVLSRNPTRPLHELIIALAGPLVNVVIALVLLAVAGLGAAFDLFRVTDLRPSESIFATPSVSSAILWLIQSNILLVVFNMIPAFPLDGGRVLRAVLAMAVGMPKATRIATTVGKVIAVLLGVYGVMSGNFSLALIAVFIFLGAGQENAGTQAQTMLTTLRVGDAYNRHAITLDIGDRVSKVVDYILTSYQPDFAVLQNGKPLGIVTRDDVLRALGTDARDLFVTGIMNRDVVRVEADTTLDEVRTHMATKSARVVAVYQGEDYLGLVSIEDIAEAYAVLTYQQRQGQLRSQEGPAAS